MSITKFLFFAHKCKLLQYLWQRNLARFILLLCNYIIGNFGIFLARCYWHINGLPTRFVASISRFCHNERVKRQAKRDLSTIIQLKFSTSFRRKDNRENRVTVFRTSPSPPRFGTIHPSFSLGSDARTIGVGYVDPVITLRGCHVGAIKRTTARGENGDCSSTMHALPKSYWKILVNCTPNFHLVTCSVLYISIDKMSSSRILKLFEFLISKLQENLYNFTENEKILLINYVLWQVSS